MEFRLNIHADNAAFELDREQEIATILREVAAKLEKGNDFSKFQTLLDFNGNDVGRAALKEDFT